MNAIICAVLTMLALAVSLSMVSSEPLWIEGESASSVPEDLLKKTASKLPASGQTSLLGKAFGKKGNIIAYQVNLPAAVKDARMTLRYSRLHVMKWTAAEVTLKVTAGGKAHKIRQTIDQTGGWGTRKAADWGTHEIKLGDLPAGELGLEFTVEKDNSDLNLDGFFICAGTLPITAAEMAACRSISIGSNGYVGLQLTNPAVNQREFAGIAVISRGFGKTAVNADAELLDRDGKSIRNIFEKKPVTIADKSVTHTITAADLGELADGSYTVRVTLANRGMIETPLDAMGDLMTDAAAKADAYEKFIPAFGKEHPVAVARVAPDFAYAVDYIRNTLVLLKSRDGDMNAHDSKHKVAMSYFEKAVQRTAAHFAADLNGIIAQTDETISRLKKGEDPYRGRSGDLRRAFYSSFSGKLEPYRLLVPRSYWKAKKGYKFLLALHGAGGDENYFPENDKGTFKKAAYELEYIVAAPKANLRYRNGGENDMAQLTRIIQKEYPAVSKKKTFCTGVSMGAGGTRRMATTYPHLYTAVAIVSGGLRGGAGPDLDLFKHIPALILHGKQDGVNTVDNAYRLADELKKRKCSYEIEVYPKYGHPYYGAEYLERTHAFFKKFM